MKLLVILCWFFQARVVMCIPLQQFLQFGGNTDGRAGHTTLNSPYRLFGTERTSLHIMDNGVLSLPNSLAAARPRNFSHTNGTVIISPFWTDTSTAGVIYYNNGDTASLTKVTELFQDSVGYIFNPTAVFTVTWVNVSNDNASSTTSSSDKNTFQCVLATNGEDTFILFLYANGLIQWARGCCEYAQVGVDGGDGVNYYSIPNSLTPEIINITHTSNVNTPGLWILKVDSNVITGPPVMIELTVSGDVWMRRENLSAVAVERGRVIFNCSFFAVPQPSVTWLLNTTNINTNQSKYLVRRRSEDQGFYTETLTILSVEDNDQGNYTCLADPVMATHSLEVIVPPKVTPMKSQIIGAENRNIRFSFTITGDDPAVRPEGILWTYTNRTDNSSTNFSSLQLHNRFQLLDDQRSLTIQSIRFFDAGWFTLTATNEAGVGIGTFELIVHVEPTFLNTMSHSNRTLEEGETAVFSCLADGYPLPNIVWLHNGQFVVINRHSRHSISLADATSLSRGYIQARNSILRVPNLRPTDAGQYECRVDHTSINRRIIISEPFDLAVVSAPLIDYCTPDPCVSGVCSNQSSTYHCTCIPAEEWTGANCSIKVHSFEEVPILEGLVLTDFPELSAIVNLTCRVMQMSKPSISWFKDGAQLLGETSSTLVIREVGVSDRGLYRCKAEIFDPINQQVMKDESDEILMNINGIAQYLGRVRSIDSDDDIAKRQISAHRNTIDMLTTYLSGMMVDENTTVLFITSTGIDIPGEGTPILITLLAENGGSSDLTERLSAIVNTTAREIALIQTLQRFDGCLADTTNLPPLEPGGLEITLKWPETSIGITATIDCLCGNLSALGGVTLGKTASRRCGGNFTAGGVWDEGRVAACNYSLITRRLCEVTEVIDKTEVAIVKMKNITREVEDIHLDEFSVATILIEAIGSRLGSNRSLIEGYFEVIDHLLDVDPKSILASQQEINATASILKAIEDVAQSIPLNESEVSTSISLSSFAVGVTRIQDPSKFKGHDFTVDLGMDFITEGEGEVTLVNDAISFTKSAKPTAAVSIPPGFFEDCSVLDSLSSARESRNVTTEQLKIVNSVYLTDALFPRRHTTSSKFTVLSVGSVILSSTLFLVSREVRVSNINLPVVITFVKKRLLFNDTSIDAICTFWDFEANEGFGDWSTLNCTLVSTDSQQAVCQCTHFTNFAILLDPNPVNRTEPPELHLFLSSVSYIGAIVSIICLIATIIAYLASMKLRTSEAGQLLLNLCFGLLGIYVLFIICLQTTQNEYACAVAGGMLHYFMLVSFLLMTAEAINLFLKLVIVLGVPPFLKDRYVLKTAIISWSVPLVIVTASEAPDYTKYKSDVFCRPYGAPFYGGLVAPFAVIYVINWIIFITIFASLCHKKSAKREGDKKGERKKRLSQQFTTAFALSILFGLGWAVGFSATTSIRELGVSAMLQALFILLTGFQGLLIFIMQCVRSQDVRKEWQRWIQAITCNRITFNLDKRLNCGPQSLSRGLAHKKSASSIKSAKAFESFTIDDLTTNELALDTTFESIDVVEDTDKQPSHTKTIPADIPSSLSLEMRTSYIQQIRPIDTTKEHGLTEKDSVDVTLTSPDAHGPATSNA